MAKKNGFLKSLKKKITAKLVYSFLAAFFSGAILSLISPPMNWHLLHWVSFVPLFLVLQNNTAKKNFWIGWFCGFVGLFFLFFWLIQTLQIFAQLPVFLAWPVHFLFCAVFSLPYGIVCSLYQYWRQHFPNSWLYPMALSWVAIEFLTPALFPYYQGLSQYRVPFIWQTVSIFGVSGLSFLVILSNGMATDWILRIRAKQKINRLVLSSVLFIFSLVSAFGFWRVHDIDQAMQTAASLKVGLVQIKEPISERIKYSFRWPTKLFLKQTQQIKMLGMDLLIWPEGILQKFKNDPEFDAKILEITGGEFALLTGVKIEMSSSRDDEIVYRNSAALFSSNGEWRAVYDKMMLVPFGESIPEALAFLNPLKPSHQTLEAGTTPTLLPLGDIKIATPICYEAILKNQMLRLAGSDLIINVTEDGWFGDTAAPHQHAMLAAASATELGKPFVRSAVNGVNLVVTPNGRFLYESKPFQNRANVVNVPLVTRQTFYTKAGYFFAPMCLAIAIGLFLWQKKWLRS